MCSLLSARSLGDIMHSNWILLTGWADSVYVWKQNFKNQASPLDQHPHPKQQTETHDSIQSETA